MARHTEDVSEIFRKAYGKGAREKKRRPAQALDQMKAV